MTLPRKPARYWGDGDFNALADAIEGVSDSMPITYNQDDAPVPPIPANSVWIDTNGGGRAYVWSGADWVSLEGPPGEQGPDGLDGIDGENGSPGPAGTSSYTHIAYANQDVSPWSGFSTSDGVNKLYIGMFVNAVEADSSNPADYNWTLIKGLDGEDGIPGPAGADGQTPYFHVAYATAADGSTGFSTTDAVGKTHIGTFTDYTEADSSNPALYTWALFKGADGSDGSNGTDGARGAGNYHLSVIAASPVDDSTFSLLANELTPGGNVFQDRVTIFNNGGATPWSLTKFWDGDSWEVLTLYINGNLLVSGTVAASKMVATDISAGLFTADVIKTTNYDEDGSGNPTAGAKLDRTGTALKVAPGSLQTGARALLTMGGGNFTLVGGNNITTAEIVELVGGQDSVKLTFSNAFPGYNPDAYFPAGYGDYLLLGGSAVFMMPSRAPVGGYKIDLVPEHRRPDYVIFGIHMNGARVNDIYNITTSSFQIRLTVGVIQIW
jgi:hypothetical protein